MTPYDLFVNALYDDALDAMERLLSESPDLAAEAQVMINCVQLGSTATVRMMIECGAPLVLQVDDGFPLLHLAIDRSHGPAPSRARGDHSVLKLLLEAGADVNERGFNDWTPLHRAAAKGDLDACKLLLLHGADRNAVTRIDHYATPEEEARHLGQHAAADLIRDF